MPIHTETSKLGSLEPCSQPHGTLSCPLPYSENSSTWKKHHLLAGTPGRLPYSPTSRKHMAEHMPCVCDAWIPFPALQTKKTKSSVKMIKAGQNRSPPADPFSPAAP